MALTRDFKETVVARVERDPAFAKALLDKATTLLLSGEAQTARMILRDLVNATLGFEQLAKLTDVPSKSLQFLKIQKLIRKKFALDQRRSLPGPGAPDHADRAEPCSRERVVRLANMPTASSAVPQIKKETCAVLELTAQVAVLA